MRKRMSHEERREQNMQIILKQSWNCFQEYGIENTRFAMIAERSGLTTRTIQRYFGTKDELLLAAIVFYIEQAVSYTKGKFGEWDFTHKTGIEQIIEFFKIQEQYFKQEYRAFLLFAELEIYFSKKKVGEEVAAHHIQHLRDVRILFQNAVECGMKDGTIRKDIDLEVLASMIMSAYGGMMRRLPMIYINETLNYVVAPEIQLNAFSKMIIAYLKC